MRKGEEEGKHGRGREGALREGVRREQSEEWGGSTQGRGRKGALMEKKGREHPGKERKREHEKGVGRVWGHIFSHSAD